MQRQLPDNIEVVHTDSLNEGDFIEIDLSDAVQIDAGEQPEFKCATDAFKRCMQDTVLASLNTDYNPERSFPMGIVHGLFCEDGAFSWKKTAINTASVGLAGAAAIFVQDNARKAVVYMTRVMTQHITGVSSDYFVGQEAVIAVVQTMNTARTLLLVTVFANSSLKSVLIKTPDADKYLKLEKPRAPGTIRLPKTLFEHVKDTAKISGRLAFDLASAAIGNFPVVLRLWSISPAQALTSYIAALPTSMIGMGGINFHREHKYPAQALEASYMRQQLFTFLAMPRPKQIAILDKIKELRDSQHPNKEKAIYSLLLNMCKPEDYQEQEELITIMRNHPEKASAIAASYVTGGLGAFSQVPFMEAAGVGVARLFENPTSPEAIAVGVLCAIMAFLPTIGFGYRGGKRAGSRMMADDPTLAEVANPELRSILKSFILCLNAFAGGISVAFSYEAASDFVNLFRLQEQAAAIFETAYVSVSLIGNTIALGQYCIDAIDEIVVFLAKHTSNEEIRRVINFVEGYKQLINIVEHMNQENYIDITANWKLTGRSELSKTLHSIFSNELNDNQYLNLQMQLRAAYELANKLKDTNVVVLENRLTQDEYIVSESFLDHHLNLRRRRPAVSPESDDIEMQFANGHKL